MIYMGYKIHSCQTWNCFKDFIRIRLPTTICEFIRLTDISDDYGTLNHTYRLKLFEELHFVIDDLTENYTSSICSTGSICI